MSDPLDLLRQAYKHTDETGKPLLKEAAEAVEALIEQLNSIKHENEVRRLDTPWPEAPASVNFRVAHPSTLIEAQFTLSDWTDEALQGRLTKRLNELASEGYIALDAYVDKRRQGRGESQPAPTQPAFTQAPPQTAGGQIVTTQLTKISAGPVSDRDNTLVYKGMTGKSKHPVNIYQDSGEAALKKLTTLNLDPYNPAALGFSEIQTPGWTCTVGLTDDGKWANKILDIFPR